MENRHDEFQPSYTVQLGYLLGACFIIGTTVFTLILFAIK